jgi:hypothetical protein
MPAMIEQGKRNLTHPIGLYAQWAAESARSIDPLFNDSMMTLARDMTPAEHDALVAAKAAGPRKRLRCLVLDDPRSVCLGNEPARMIVGQGHDARCYLHGDEADPERLEA